MRHGTAPTAKWILTALLMIGMLHFAVGVASAKEADVVMTGGGTHQAGESFRIVLTYGGETFGTGTVMVAYDDEVLEYISCSGAKAFGGSGTVRITLDGGVGANQLSCKLKFRGKAKGDSFVTATTSNLYNIDMDTLQAETRSVKVKIKGDKSQSKAEGDQGPEEEEAVKTDGTTGPIRVKVGKTAYDLITSLTDTPTPEGFYRTVFKWKGEEVDVIANEEKDVVLFLLENTKEHTRGWFFYNEEKDGFSSSIQVTADKIMKYEGQNHDSFTEEEQNELGVLGAIHMRTIRFIRNLSPTEFMMVLMSLTSVILLIALRVAGIGRDKK
ncbi:MAG: hypothetical protein HFE73_06285 [Firmicutes bacterium]|nr:hypothetical protein [Bacillota bacterium]